MSMRWSGSQRCSDSIEALVLTGKTQGCAIVSMKHAEVAIDDQPLRRDFNVIGAARRRRSEPQGMEGDEEGTIVDEEDDDGDADVEEA